MVSGDECRNFEGAPGGSSSSRGEPGVVLSVDCHLACDELQFTAVSQFTNPLSSPAVS